MKADGILVCAALLLSIGAACGGAPTSPRTPQPSQSSGGTRQSEHFEFVYTALDTSNIGEIASDLEREYARIVTDLGVQSMPRVRVRLYPDQAALAAALAPVIGPVPAWVSGAATRADEIHLISPNHPAFAPYSRMISNLVHEFAHCVSLQVNPRIANNPRWFWESVAIFEARQFVDPTTLDYMTAGRPPSLASLNSLENTAIYQVGYTIGEFIAGRGGPGALRDLVANHADVSRTLGLTEDAFEREWLAFVRGRYGI